MSHLHSSIKASAKSLQKCPTGIVGLDECLGGGLPRGRNTLVCGEAGSGKTLLAMEFLVRGALEHGDPGVYFSLDENVDDLLLDTASLGYDLTKLIRQKQI